MIGSRTTRLAVAGTTIVVFWPLALIIDRDHLFDVMNALAVAVGCGVTFGYARAALQCFRDEICTAGHLLVGGIVLAWLAIVIRLVLTWIWRIFDYPTELAEHLLLAFGMWLLAVGGALHITARNATGETIPAKNWIILGFAVAGGAVMATVLVLLGGELRR